MTTLQVPCGRQSVSRCLGHQDHSALTKAHSSLPWSLPCPKEGQPECIPTLTPTIHEPTPPGVQTINGRNEQAVSLTERITKDNDWVLGDQF